MKDRLFNGASFAMLPPANDWNRGLDNAQNRLPPWRQSRARLRSPRCRGDRRPDLRCSEGQGFVQCAVNTGLAGFSFADSQGKWTGLDVDLCKAIAGVAMFGDAEKVKFTPTTAQQRFVALQSGEVDVITRNATQTCCATPHSASTSPASISTTARASSCRPRAASRAPRNWNGATICVQPGTTTELNLADYFRKSKMTFKPVLIEKLDERRGRLPPAAATPTRPMPRACRGAWPMPARASMSVSPERISKEPRLDRAPGRDDQCSTS